MADNDLGGIGVLVTRPSHQAGDLVNAINAAGGNALQFPVIDIQPIDADLVCAARAAMPAPDVVIFISRNAVEHGIAYVGNALIAAIGPATATAVTAAGQTVDIRAEDGFNSEHLLETPAFQDVAGKTILIIRGTSGREHLGDTLRSRGADVRYLAAYERRVATPSSESLSRLESAWLAGGIGAVTIMSVESLERLAELLPTACADLLETIPLVTPAERVIKEAMNRFPASRSVLASGPEASAMVRAISSVVNCGQAQ